MVPSLLFHSVMVLPFYFSFLWVIPFFSLMVHPFCFFSYGSSLLSFPLMIHPFCFFSYGSSLLSFPLMIHLFCFFLTVHLSVYFLLVRQQLKNRRFADFLPGPASQTFYMYSSRIFTSKTSTILK
jgi:hypothetical protein